MVKSNNVIVSIFLCLLVLSGFACSKKGENAVDVKTLMEARCSVCHFSTNIYTVVKTPEQWRLTVDRMKGINPDVMSDEESELITVYLQEQVSRKKAN